MIKFRITTGLLIGFVITTNTFAEVNCPDINAIKNISFDKIINEGNSSWSGVISKNHFGTDSNWSFTLAYAYSTNKRNAKQLLTEEMQTIKYDYRYGDSDYTACMYVTADNKMNGAAISPPIPYVR